MSSFALQVAGRTGIQEVAGEPPDGQKAFAHVLWNRVKDGRWTVGGYNTLATVCHAHWQFSAWDARDAGDQQNFAHSFAMDDADPKLVAMIAIIQAAQTEPDPTGGATHYYNPRTVPEPAWVRGDASRGIPPAIPCGQHGHQLFFKGVR